jgi:hypothetical protein
MSAFAEPLSSAAWILGQAAARVGAASLTIAFGDTVTVLVPPGVRPSLVYEMRADAGTEQFDDAVALADRLINLTGPGAVRLAVVVSDGYFRDTATAQATITALAGSGCHILWLAPAGREVHTYRDTTIVAVGDPAACAAIIGRAATRVLTKA